uniref:Leucine-rich repeat domain-containing protein n=1 Tax=Chaetoceros debilis TaxID=122233 RepID=A0A7S3Q5T2_9STRA|mmetsp:Transcript_4147/g.6110  ORF Transcript_4147/g.6110 Transcript_4147/m.6110 type:complete len:311 (+) Transcript_4147:106-1038(+)
MILYSYRGDHDERVPSNVSHVIIEESVTTIKEEAFYNCHSLVSVIMGDSVHTIEFAAFSHCRALQFIRLSKTLKVIGIDAFRDCRSLNALFLPSTVNVIQGWSFQYCRSLRFLILPDDFNLSHVGNMIIRGTPIHQFAEAAGIGYEFDYPEATDGISPRINEWLFRHMDESPFHKGCYDSSITTRKVNDYLNEHGKASAFAVDAIHGMTPLHILAMNPYASADTIAALHISNTQAALSADNQGKTTLEYARDNNVGGMVEILMELCNHKNAAIPIEDTHSSQLGRLCCLPIPRLFHSCFQNDESKDPEPE